MVNGFVTPSVIRFTVFFFIFQFSVFRRKIQTLVKKKAFVVVA